LSKISSPLREDIKSEDGVFIPALDLLFSDIECSLRNEDYEKNLRRILRLFVYRKGPEATMALLYNALRNIQGTKNLIGNENKKSYQLNLTTINNNIVLLTDTLSVMKGFTPDFRICLEFTPLQEDNQHQSIPRVPIFSSQGNGNTNTICDTSNIPSTAPKDATGAVLLRQPHEIVRIPSTNSTNGDSNHTLWNKLRIFAKKNRYLIAIGLLLVGIGLVVYLVKRDDQKLTTHSWNDLNQSLVEKPNTFPTIKPPNTSEPGSTDQRVRYEGKFID